MKYIVLFLLVLGAPVLTWANSSEPVCMGEEVAEELRGVWVDKESQQAIVIKEKTKSFFGLATKAVVTNKIWSCKRDNKLVVVVQFDDEPRTSTEGMYEALVVEVKGDELTTYGEAYETSDGLGIRTPVVREYVRISD